MRVGRAYLVAEDVLDLPQLLDEARRAAQRGRVRRRVVHVEVCVDSLRLLVFDDFHPRDERDRYQIVVEDNEREDVCGR